MALFRGTAQRLAVPRREQPALWLGDAAVPPRGAASTGTETPGEFPGHGRCRPPAPFKNPTPFPSGEPRQRQIRHRSLTPRLQPPAPSSGGGRPGTAGQLPPAGGVGGQGGAGRGLPPRPVGSSQPARRRGAAGPGVRDGRAAERAAPDRKPPARRRAGGPGPRLPFRRGPRSACRRPPGVRGAGRRSLRPPARAPQPRGGAVTWGGGGGAAALRSVFLHLPRSGERGPGHGAAAGGGCPAAGCPGCGGRRAGVDASASPLCRRAGGGDPPWRRRRRRRSSGRARWCRSPPSAWVSAGGRSPRGTSGHGAGMRAPAEASAARRARGRVAGALGGAGPAGLCGPSRVPSGSRVSLLGWV